MLICQRSTCREARCKVRKPFSISQANQTKIKTFQDINYLYINNIINFKMSKNQYGSQVDTILI